MWLRDLVLSLAVPAYGLAGVPLVRSWERRNNLKLDVPTRYSAGFALMLLWAQAGVMVAGWGGVLRTCWVATWLMAGWSAGLMAQIRLECRPWRIRVTWPTIISGSIIILYAIIATVPPWDRDEMVYHLALPRYVAQHGRFAVPDDNIFAYFPFGWESIITIPHVFGHAPDFYPIFNPRLLGVAASVFGALGTVGLARTLGAQRLSWLAGFALLCVPSFIEFGSSAYVEPYLVLFTTLALLTLIRVVQGDGRFLLPAAVLAGNAASIKYSGLAFCAFANLLSIGQLFLNRVERRQALQRIGLFALVSVSIACPFYVRNVMERGNPVFPLAWDLWGGQGWDSIRSAAYMQTLTEYGMGASFLDTVLLPIRAFLSVDIERGFQGSIGPLVGLGYVAGIAYVLRRLRNNVPLSLTVPKLMMLAFCIVWFGFWALSVQQARFLLVVVPPLLALSASVAATTLRRRWFRPVSIATVFLAVGWAISPVTYLWNRQHTSDWLLLRKDREQMLSTLLPESYPMQRFLETIVPPSGRVALVWMRAYTYYLRRAYRVDCVFEAWRVEKALEDQPTPAAFAQSLVQEGITHLLVHRGFFLRGDNADLVVGRTAVLRERWDKVLGAGYLKLQHERGSIALYEILR